MEILQTSALPLGYVAASEKLCSIPLPPVAKAPYPQSLSSCSPKANLLLGDLFSQWKKGFNWSGQRGSNSLPPPWQGGALPDELCPHTNVVPPTRLCSTTLTLRWPSLPSSRKPKQMSRARSQLLASSLHSMQEPPKGFSRDGNYPGRIFLVPPTGIEPVTRGFSVLCSTD